MKTYYNFYCLAHNQRDCKLCNCKNTILVGASKKELTNVELYELVLMRHKFPKMISIHLNQETKDEIADSTNTFLKKLLSKMSEEEISLVFSKQI